MVSLRSWCTAAIILLLLVPAGRAEDRILRTEAVVHAPVADVWKAFTTKEGVQSWMVPVAEVDLRIGGTIKTNYNPKAKIGDPGTIVHHILSYEPERMLTTRFSAAENGPAWAKKAEATWVVYRFEPVGEKDTRVTVSMMGWGEGPEWADSYEHFRRGNEWTIEQLMKAYCPSRPSKAAAQPVCK